ncbi:hypothetical protein H9L39_08789 [Fusarium oxysporum f. sp. albedinis]|nr:hypothetical protein H9L39_08789 [Fusarium oxysporum f. sp. albedinis]
MNPNVEAAGPALHWWLSGCSVPEIFTAPYLMSYPKVKPEFLLERETVLPAAAIGYQASDFLRSAFWPTSRGLRAASSLTSGP